MIISFRDVTRYRHFIKAFMNIDIKIHFKMTKIYLKRNLIVFHGKRIFDYDNDKIRYWIKIFHNFLQKSDM